MGLSAQHILLLLVIALLLFGRGKISELMGDVAKGIKSFKKGMAEDDDPVFVAVLASIPRSGTSRIDALKTFADMQQKYGSALAGKTPDVASATLTKGAYDRLVVGPPGSREEANNVCSQLKAQGYKDCWVTSY